MWPKSRTGRIIASIAVIFCLYAIIHDPNGSAEVVKKIWNVAYSAVQSIFTFFGKILN